MAFWALIKIDIFIEIGIHTVSGHTAFILVARL